MANPFVDLVNKVRSRLFASSNGGSISGTTSLARLDKSAGERFSKTVMPNSRRTIAPQEPLQAASTISGPPNTMTATKTGPRMISLGGASQSGIKPHELPPAIALALEPKVERGLSLQLADILDKVPAGYIKSEESFDPTRRILLKALEVEKGMAKRNPSVALTSIYEQIPDIFMRSVPLTDQTRIALPFDKVLEQFNRMQIRRDQVRDTNVPQVDTPFLVVALEESEKFGTTIDPIQTAALPAVKVEPASAEAFAAAEPEAAESAKFVPQEPKISHPEPRMPEPVDSSPARIPFDLPPKGTGAPASERVPASSGRPVLSSVPLRSDAPKQSLPVEPPRNPYEPVPFDQLKLSLSEEKKSTPEVSVEKEPGARQVTADATDAKVHLVTEASKGAEVKIPFSLPPVTETSKGAGAKIPLSLPSIKETSKEAGTKIPLSLHSVTEVSKGEEIKISLSLRGVLQNLPAFQRQGEPSLAPDDAKISFPFSLLADQLATGRISVPSQVFLEAIPTEHRYLFHLDEEQAPVLLPLQEVLKNMPATALQMRADQERPATEETIVTPFSLQAEEDAKRLKPDDKEKSRDAGPVPEIAPRIDKVAEKVVAKVDAKQMVARATALPGVDGCAITFADGLSLAGNLPVTLAADGLCAVAPTLFERINRHMVETKLGALDSMTLRGANSSITFFTRGEICLSAVHADGALAAETRAALAQIVSELSKMYSQPEISHVDH